MFKMSKCNIQVDVRKQLYIICMVSLIDIFGVSLVVPVLSTHLVSLGVSHFYIGLSRSAYSFMQLLSGPCIGSWSDLSGRKNVLTLTLIVCSVCYLSLGSSSIFIVIFLSRFILGSFKSTQILCKTIIADVIPTDQQLEAYGLFTSITSLGFVMGPTLGGHLVELENGFFYVCCLTSLLFFINAFIVYIFIKDPAEKLNSKGTLQASILSQIKSTFSKLISIKWGKHYPVFLVKFLIGVAVFLFFSNYTLYMREAFEMSPSAIGYTVSFQGAISSLAGFFIKFVNFAKSSTMRCYYLLILLSLSFLFLASIQSLNLFMCFLIPLFVSYSLLRVVTVEMVFENSDYSERGSLNGAINSVMSISRLMAPVFSGCIIDNYGYKAVLFLSCILCGLAAVFCKFISVQKKKTN